MSPFVMYPPLTPEVAALGLCVVLGTAAALYLLRRTLPLLFVAIIAVCCVLLGLLALALVFAALPFGLMYWAGSGYYKYLRVKK